MKQHVTHAVDCRGCCIARSCQASHRRVETPRQARPRPVPAQDATERTVRGAEPNPALAGKKEDQLIQALKDYKSGKRANAMMKTFATQLSDQDAANVAAYYASLKGK